MQRLAIVDNDLISVQPAKVLAQVNVQRYITMYEELGINARMFTDADEAFTWLDAQ